MFESFRLSKTEKTILALGGIAMLALAYCAFSKKKEIYDSSEDRYDTIDPPYDPYEIYDDYDEEN